MSEKRPRNTSAGSNLADQILRNPKFSSHPECGAEERDALANEILSGGGQEGSKVCPPEKRVRDSQIEAALDNVVGGSGRYKRKEYNGTSPDELMRGAVGRNHGETSSGTPLPSNVDFRTLSKNIKSTINISPYSQDAELMSQLNQDFIHNSPIILRIVQNQINNGQLNKYNQNAIALDFGGRNMQIGYKSDGGSIVVFGGREYHLSANQVNSFNRIRRD